MNTTKLQDLYLSGDIMTPDNISSQFVYKSPDGNVTISNLSATAVYSAQAQVGEDYFYVDSQLNSIHCGKSSVTYAHDCAAFGESCTAGNRGFTMISVEKQDSSDTDFIITLSSEDYSADQLDSMINEIVGNKFSIQCTIGTKSGTQAAIDYGEIAANLGGGKILAVIPEGYAPFSLTTPFADFWVLSKPAVGTHALGSGGFAAGLSSTAVRVGAHAEGMGCIAGTKYAHAEGNSTIAGHAAHSEGEQTKAYGSRSHTEGFGTETNTFGQFDVGAQHAEGVYTRAFGEGSHAAGYGSEAKVSDYFSYVWAGKSTYSSGKPSSFKTSHGPGTYSLYPVDDEDGIYIGEKTLKQLITDIANNAVDEFGIRQNISGLYSNGTYITKCQVLGYDNTLSSPSQVIRQSTTPYVIMYKDLDLQGILSGSSTTSFAGQSPKLTDVEIPNVLSIGSYAFYKCPALEIVDMQKCEKLQDRVFSGCSNLHTIYAKNLSSIGTVPFEACKKLSSMYVENSVMQSVNNNTILQTHDSSGNTVIKLIALGISAIDYDCASPVIIDNFACYNRSSALSVNIPAAKQIGKQAFYNATTLQIANLPNLTSIGLESFLACSMLKKLDFSERSDALSTNIPILPNPPTALYCGLSTTPDYYMIPGLSVVVRDDMYDKWCKDSHWNIEVNISGGGIAMLSTYIHKASEYTSLG